MLFTALVAFVLYGERIGRVRSLALLIGFVGVVVLAVGRTAGRGADVEHVGGR